MGGSPPSLVQPLLPSARDTQSRRGGERGDDFWHLFQREGTAPSPELAAGRKTVRVNWGCPRALVTTGTGSLPPPLQPWGQATSRSLHAAREEKRGVRGAGEGQCHHRQCTGGDVPWHGDGPPNQGGASPPQRSPARALRMSLPPLVLTPWAPSCHRPPAAVPQEPLFRVTPSPHVGQEGDLDSKVVTGGLRGDTALAPPPPLRSQLWPPRPSSGTGREIRGHRLFFPK